MIQFLAAAAFLLVGGSFFKDCSGKKEETPKKEESKDLYQLISNKTADFSWASSRLQNYCKQFSDINLDSICARRLSDKAQPHDCIRNPNPDQILGIAIGWNRLKEYEPMKKSACFAFELGKQPLGYQILATALNNEMSEQPSSGELADTLAASEKAVESSPQDLPLRKLTATINGLVADRLLQEKQTPEAYRFYQRASALYETLDSNTYSSKEDLTNRLSYYNSLISLKLQTDDFTETKKYFRGALEILSSPPSETLIGIQTLDLFVHLYQEGLKKNPPPLILDEKEANWETIGRTYYQLAKSEQDCNKAEEIMIKARNAFKLAGKAKQYSNLTKSTCNPHN